MTLPVEVHLLKTHDIATQAQQLILQERPAVIPCQVLHGHVLKLPVPSEPIG
jgi:hypothetical protein